MTDATDTTLTVNGAARPVRARPWTTLLEVLRDQLGLTGAKRGCNQGVCGACTVLVDGRPVRSCLSLALNCDDSEITTVEGLATGDTLSRVQAGIEAGNAVQCGFCTPGVVISAHALLAEKPDASIDDIRIGLSGNLCRCSGYKKIVDAVAAVVTSARAGDRP